MFRHPLVLPLDKAQLYLLQLISFKDREMKNGKEHISASLGRRLERKGSGRKKVINQISLVPSPNSHSFPLLFKYSASS